jgi:NitT/TauT family transport system substrate-binding protein
MPRRTWRACRTLWRHSHCRLGTITGIRIATDPHFNAGRDLIVARPRGSIAVMINLFSFHLHGAPCMKKTLIAVALASSLAAHAQDTKVAVGISGWTGFAPLTLAAQAVLLEQPGLDVSIKKIPQKDRHLAIASGDIQCAATTVETWVVWNANGVATTQIFQLDKSFGADGMVVKPNIAKIADLKGKTVAADAPGTAGYFGLAWILKKNGLSVKDVKVVNMGPQPAANAMIAGTDGIDAAMTYEPYLSAVRAKPEAGKIIATTLDYPMVMDTFGCTPKFLADNPKAAQALANAYFDALDLIKTDPKKSFEIMGADVKQSGEAFEASQKYLRWQDRAANQTFFAGEHAAFSKEAADLLLEIGIIKQAPDMAKLADTRFIK